MYASNYVNIQTQSFDKRLKRKDKKRENLIQYSVQTKHKENNNFSINYIKEEEN